MTDPIDLGRLEFRPAMPAPTHTDPAWVNRAFTAEKKLAAMTQINDALSYSLSEAVGDLWVALEALRQIREEAAKSVDIEHMYILTIVDHALKEIDGEG